MRLNYRSPQQNDLQSHNIYKEKKTQKQADVNGKDQHA